jgi:hypothetical protein
MRGPTIIKDKVMKNFIIVLFLLFSSCAATPILKSDGLNPELGLEEIGGAVNNLIPEDSVLPEESGFVVGEKVVAVLRIVSGGNYPINIGYIFPDKFAIGTIKKITGKFAYVDWGNNEIYKISILNLAHYTPKKKNDR